MLGLYSCSHRVVGVAGGGPNLVDVHCPATPAAVGAPAALHVANGTAVRVVVVVVAAPALFTVLKAVVFCVFVAAERHA